MSQVISTVHLFSLNVDRRGNIHMNATRSFFEVMRSKLGASVGSTLRVGTFDFCEVRKSQFVATPDDRNEASLEEAQKLASHVLSIYRSILLFEKVFAEHGSYDKFVLFNRRAPSFKELQTMAKARNIYVPFLSLPYKADLCKTSDALATVITESAPVKQLTIKRDAVVTAFLTKAQVPVTSKKARLLVRVNRSATQDQLHALTAKFGRSFKSLNS